MPPATPRRTRGGLFIAWRAGSARGFFLDELFLLRFRLFAGRIEDAALGAIAPPDEVLAELGGRQARRLQGPIGLELGTGSAHELLRSPREQKNQPELAVHTFGNRLDHVFQPLLAKVLAQSFEKSFLS